MPRGMLLARTSRTRLHAAPTTPRTMPTQPPRSLWTDRDEDRQWAEPEPPTTPAGATPPPAPPKRRRGRRLVLALLVLAIGTGGFLAGRELQDPQQQAATRITLPTVSGKTAKTRANQIYSQIKEGVVQIGAGNGSGSGFVVDQSGVIVTNAHVVGTATKVEVYFNDSKVPVPGTVTGTDVSWDLATVKVDPKAAKLVPLALADSNQVQPGDEVLAIGYPLGLDRTLTQGIISGLGRHIDAQNGFSIDKVIQTDASINPGNSGGPLVDARGRVIGVNSQIATLAAGSNTGIGFAVPSNTVRAAVPTLAAGEAVKHPYVGVSLGDTKQPGNGAEIGDVTSGAPGAKAGLRAGDVVTAVDGKTIASADEFISAIADRKVGEKVKVTVQRGGQSSDLTVTLADRPKQAPSASSRDTDPQSPFQIP